MYVTAAILSVLLALVTLAAGAPKTVLKGDVSAGLQSHMGLSAASSASSDWPRSPRRQA